MLSYETNTMTREDIVRATYDSALKLNEFKYKNNIVTKDVHDEVAVKIQKSVEFLKRWMNWHSYQMMRKGLKWKKLKKR